MFCKKGVLKKFKKFTGKHQCQSLFFNKVASFRPFEINFNYRTPLVATSDGFLFFFAKGKRVIKCNFVNIVVGIKIIFLWKCLSNCEVSFQKQPPEVFCEKSILKNFTKFKGKHLCWSLFLINLHASSPAILLKRDSNTGVFL